MANKNLNDVIIQFAYGTKAEWASSLRVLEIAEIGIETDTNKFKIGNGVNVFNALPYASSLSAITNSTGPTASDSNYDIGQMWVDTTNSRSYILYSNGAGAAIWKQIITPEDLAALGGGDMLKATFATNPKADQGYVDSAIEADKWSNPVTLTITGDVSGSSLGFDGSNNITLATALANVVTAGTYTKITVNSKGLVTGFEALTSNDIPELTLDKISDAGTAAALDTGTSAGQVVVVGADGKLNNSIIPAIAITDVYIVNSEAEMLAIVGTVGDVAIRADESQTYILQTAPSSVLSNWILMQTPESSVLAVNGETGVVTLDTDNIPEGATNLYFTEARANANFNTNIKATNVTDLVGGAAVVFENDTIKITGGTATP